MFYIKTKRNHCIPIEDGDDGNVFTKCPGCGKEFEVDLSDFIVDGKLDMYGTAWYCTKCSANRHISA